MKAFIPLSLLLSAVLGVFLTTQIPKPLLADGGTLRVSNVPMGAYRVNVFTDPTPIPPDTIDVSVLVTFERGRGVAQGLEIVVAGRPLGTTDWVISHPATREQAEDPRYYAEAQMKNRIDAFFESLQYKRMRQGQEVVG